MPRQLLRDGRVVADDWTYLADGDSAGAGTAVASGGLIMAATHGPIGLAKTQELRLDQASPSLAQDQGDEQEKP